MNYKVSWVCKFAKKGSGKSVTPNLSTFCHACVTVDETDIVDVYAETHKSVR
jgi:hypothetical protein